MKLLVPLMLVLPVVGQADVYESTNGVRSFSDRPAHVATPPLHSNETLRRQKRDHLGIRPVAVDAHQRLRITRAYQDAETELETLEQQKQSTCGDQPRGGFAGFGPKRDRHIAYDKCSRSFEQALETARDNLKIAYRNYLRME